MNSESFENKALQATDVPAGQVTITLLREHGQYTAINVFDGKVSCGTELKDVAANTPIEILEINSEGEVLQRFKLVEETP